VTVTKSNTDKPGPLTRLPSQRTVSVSLVLAASFYLGYAVFAGKTQLLAAISSLGGLGILLILGCSLANYLIRFFRWNWFLRRLGHSVPLWRHFLYYIAGFALTTTPGKAGETVRSLYLKRHQVNFTHSLAAFFTERLLDVLALVLLAQFAVLALPGFEFIAVIGLGFGLLIIAFLLSTRVLDFIDTASFDWAPSRRRTGVRHLLALLRTAHFLFQPKPFLVGLLLGITAWFIQGLAFVYVCTALGVTLPMTTLLAIYALGILAGAISFIPGGIGSTEAAMAALLYTAGAPDNAVLMAPFLIRLGTLWFAVCLGLSATAVLSWLGNAVPLPTTNRAPD
jgi:uncharacterized protein (TIRG00374 family)